MASLTAELFKKGHVKQYLETFPTLSADKSALDDQYLTIASIIICTAAHAYVLE